ncbi:MAG TPA: hypothetical protein VK427_26600, partial [Kofleriaceae bacterium]|nr:hypothetical protein [Kofleriaceae bacterium]
MTRPAIRADVAAALTIAIPPRLVKKLDAEPMLAERWTWGATTVTTDKGETVTLVLEDHVVTAVTCSCLLAPKCLHVAAVVARLEPADAPPPSTSAPVVAASTAPADESAAARASAARALRTLADVLATGAEATGAFAQAELLRAIHACRTAGLHRLAAAQTRVLRSVRDLRADTPEVSLGTLTADLREALVVAHAITGGELTRALAGAARREYTSIGNLRLRGVLTEAVIAQSGYAGAITYLVDDAGTFYTRADIAPGDASRAAGAYQAGAAIGDAVLPHRELCRSGLFVSDATASIDGRLGAGQRVRAARASEPSLWSHPVLASRFTEPVSDQLARLAARDADPDELRPAGWDLVFLAGVLVGGAVLVGDVAVRLTTTLDHRVLATRDNLAVLARASGLHVYVIGRARIGTPRELELLAIGPAPDESRFPLPAAWHGRANVHYDRMSIVAGAGAFSVPDAPEPPRTDLLAPLRRRIERAVLGGSATLPTHAIGELEHEARLLDECALGGGAETLRDLAAFAHDGGRSAA